MKKRAHNAIDRSAQVLDQQLIRSDYMSRKILGYYSVFIGIAVISFWIMILLGQDISEGKMEMSFHLTSEFIMAILCLVSGIMLILNNKIAKVLNILGLGMVVYSVLNAAGYYGERGNMIMMVMFLVLLILTTIAILLNLKTK